MKKHLLYQRGDHVATLAIVLVVALVGVLGFVGYNTWQKKQANAAETATVTPVQTCVTKQFFWWTWQECTILSFSASVAQLSSGQSATLKWSTTNATTCTASGNWSGSKPTNGTESTAAISQSSQYTLSCNGVGGIVSKTLPIVVQASSNPPAPQASGRTYPVHTNIVATTFWVGEIFDPNASDGSQMYSTYDSNWYKNYGGCDGNDSTKTCKTEVRTAANNYFPTRMTPKQNPFYLDLPFDDVNDKIAFSQRAKVIPWANDPGYAGKSTDPNFSYMKNRWVKLMYNNKVCYAQIEDAGPGEYHDSSYVFGSNDARPLNTRYGKAGMDVSPAVVGILGFKELNGMQGGVSWQFVDDIDVPDGLWKKIVTKSSVQ